MVDSDGPREWDAETGQKSEPVHLVAGGRYYLEVVMAESDGPDHLAVRWRLPDGRLEEPIPVTRFEFLPRLEPNSGSRRRLPPRSPSRDSTSNWPRTKPAPRCALLVLDPPRHGQLSLSGSSRWWFDVLTNLVYTPDPDFNGPDAFTYQLVDQGGATSAPATIFLEVNYHQEQPPILTLPVTRLNILEDE